MKKLLICMCMVLLLVTSCGKVPVLKNGEEAVITSDKTNISVNELYQEMKNNYALATLIDMIDMKLLEQEYPSDDEEKDYIEAQLEQLEYSYKNSYYVNYYASFNTFAPAYFGVTDMDAVNKLLALQYKRSLYEEDYARTLVTDKDIQKYYDDKVIGDIKASHILIKADFEDTATDEEKEKAYEEALKTAKEVIAKLNNGEDFATLAKEYSDDGSKDKGGELDWFNRGKMVEEFEEAAIKLEKGKYTTEPVKTQYGYHIILKMDQRDKPELKDVKEEIIDILSEEKMDADENFQVKALIQLRKDKGITFEDDTLKKQYDNYVSNIK